ncbi:hypothetical protein KM043_018109 [Ampulex compressa]|nr:hypothetical protein KM043_018109 [Ampulex compressa]
MSQDAVKPMKHGYCDAIFSSSPVSFVKQNKFCVEKDTRNRNQVDTQSEKENNTQQHGRQKLGSKNTATDPSRTVTKSGRTNTDRPRSTNMLQKQNNSFSNNIMPFAKHKTPIKGGSVVITDNKTPVSHFCTPKHFRPHTFTGSTKMNILPATRTPIKCYFMDNASLQATPECFSNVQLETPCVKSTEIGVEDQTVCEGEKSNLTVGIRIRPLNSKETDDPKITSVVSVNGQNIIVEGESIHHTFTYDHCFSSYLDPTHSDYASQESIFKTMVLPLVHDAFEGYNVCLLAYGQTGSGKSYSMMGQDLSQTGVMSLDEGSGVIPRFCQEIFARVSKNVETTTTVEISYFEIYNEKIHDLLAAVTSGSKRAPLKVREHPIFGPYIVDLSQHCVQNYKDLQTWLKVGNSQRATAATGMNEKSSRSHCIFSIVITQTKSEGQQKSNILDASRRSKINLVDLAGSERLSQTCASGDRLKEGVSINKSLLTLGKVIASLAENTSNRRRGFVPYRESVLTWLLKEFVYNI